jgi:hypothetical protein
MTLNLYQTEQALSGKIWLNINKIVTTKLNLSMSSFMPIDLSSYHTSMALMLNGYNKLIHKH